MAKTSPVQFLQQVRNEAKKVSFPSRKETTVSTVMVLITVALASVFFFVVDQLLAWGIQLVFGVGG